MSISEGNLLWLFPFANLLQNSDSPVMNVIFLWLSMRQNAHLDHKTLPPPGSGTRVSHVLRSIFALDKKPQGDPFSRRAMHAYLFSPLTVTMNCPALLSLHGDQHYQLRGCVGNDAFVQAIYDIAVPWILNNTGSLRREEECPPPASPSPSASTRMSEEQELLPSPAPPRH